jgi:hypothetical protein
MISDSEPNLCCGPLKIWVLGRQFPDATDYWDGNWLNIVAHYSVGETSITVRGPMLHLGEITIWKDDLIKMRELLRGDADLPTTEPNLRVKLRCNHLGHVEVNCSITPEHLSEHHTFAFEMDQTYLPALIGQCERVLEEYPVRDAQRVFE